jgi:hypothetical protein
MNKNIIVVIVEEYTIQGQDYGSIKKCVIINNWL